MAKWLLKSEPSDYSIDDLAQDKVTAWNGIRNFQARNFIKEQMAIGDLVFFYHSSCKHTGVVGIGKIVSKAYADPDQFDQQSHYYDVKSEVKNPKWYVIDVQFERKAETIFLLKNMKAAPELEDFILFKQSRLSVLPVSDKQWLYIISNMYS